MSAESQNLGRPLSQRDRTRITILGAGFGGLYTALHLRKLARGVKIDVTLVSRDNYFLMTPLLFEAGSGVLEPRHAVSPVRTLIGREVEFIEAEIEAVDVDARRINLRQSGGERRVLEFDQLVLALGGVTNRQIIPGSEHAMAFKTLADAIFLRNHIIDLFERAAVERDAARRRAMLRFVIIGAGLVGVELTGEMTEFVDHLRELYPQVTAGEITFDLIEAGKRILPEMEEDLADHARRTLAEKRNVRVRVATPVQQIEPTRVHLPEGEPIESATIILATGVTTNPLLKDIAVEKDRKGRVAVEATMRSKSHPHVWALGDCAAIPTGDEKGTTQPALAQHALREARVLARNISAAIANRPLEAFEYKSLGTLAALGHYDGVGRVMKLKLRGFLAWWVWRSYYLMQMPRWERRIRIMLDWTVALLFKNDIVKLDLFGDTHPSKPGTRAGERNGA